MAPGGASAGLGRMKPIAELFGPVVSDESDPLFMGADGHSNSTGEPGHESHKAAWATSEVSTGLNLATLE